VPLQHDDVLKLGPLEFKVVIETKAAGAKPTPPPPKPLTAAAGQDDESVAAMLLSLQDEGPKAAGEEPTSADPAEVPEGSTIMNLNGLKGAAADTPPPDQPKPAAAKKPDPKTDPAHLAAKSILEKYNRRTRG
jgi:hypothetical protein